MRHAAGRERAGHMMKFHQDDRIVKCKACANLDERYGCSVQYGYLKPRGSTPLLDERAGGAPVHHRYSQTRQRLRYVCDSSHHLRSYMAENVVEHSIGYINTCWRDTITKLHCGVDFINQQAALRVFQHVDSENAAAYSLRSSHTQAIQFRRNGTVAGNRATRCIRYPMLAGAIDGADSMISNHKGANITLRLGYVLLHIVNMVLVGAKRLLVFEDRFRRVTIIDAGQ